MSTMAVRHLGSDRFSIAVRDHMLLVDQPESGGGEDTAPTPTELGGYLPKNASDGFGLIACKTIAGDRVEDCVELGQTPGSELPPVLPTTSPDLPLPPGVGWIFTPYWSGTLCHVDCLQKSRAPRMVLRRL